MNDKYIRRRILEMLFDTFRTHPYSRITPKDFRKELNIALKELHYNIIYLEEKGYVELQKPHEGCLFVGARITAKGVDLIEDDYEFDILFPKTTEPAKVPQNIYEELSLIEQAIQDNENMDKSKSETLLENIADLKKILQTIPLSYTRIKKTVDIIKLRDYVTGEQIALLLKTPQIKKLLLDSAKRELGII